MFFKECLCLKPLTPKLAGTLEAPPAPYPKLLETMFRNWHTFDDKRNWTREKDNKYSFDQVGPIQSD